MQNYGVTYTIAFNTGQAIASLKKFEAQIQRLSSVNPLVKLQKSVDSLSKALNTNTRLKIDTKEANAKLDALIAKAQKLKATLGGVSVGGKGGSSTVVASGASASVGSRSGKTSNVGSKAASQFFGQPMFGNNVIGIDLLKGVGVMYGVSAIGSAVSQIVKDAVAYDNSMQSVRNILRSHDMSDTFDSRFENMERVVRNIGVQTKFTAPQVADASKYLAMAGFNADEIKGSMPAIANLALIGDHGLSEVADVTTNIMSGFNMKSNDMNHAADILANTFTMTNTTLLEVAESMKFAAPIYGSFGGDFAELSAAIGVLGDAGLKGSIAGTGMRQLAANLLAPKKAFQQTGIQVLEKDGKTMRSLIDIFKDIKKLPGFNNDMLYKFFRINAANAAIVLLEHMDKWEKVKAENKVSFGLSDNLADKKKETIDGLWAQLTSAFTEDGMVAFSGIQAEVRHILKSGIEYLQSPEALKTIRSFINGFMEFFNALKSIGSYLLDIYKRFEVPIKAYVNFQMRLVPLIATINVFRSAWAGFSAMTLGAWSVRTVANVERVRWSLSELLFSVDAARSRIVSSGIGSLFSRAGAMVGGVASGAGGYMLGSGIAQLSGASDTTAQLIGTGGGMLGMMVSGAIGVPAALAVAAVGAGVYFAAEAKRVHDLVDKYTELHTVKKNALGLYTGDKLNSTLEGLDLLFDKEKKITDVILARSGQIYRENGASDSGYLDIGEFMVPHQKMAEEVSGFFNVGSNKYASQFVAQNRNAYQRLIKNSGGALFDDDNRAFAIASYKAAQSPEYVAKVYKDVQDKVQYYAMRGEIDQAIAQIMNARNKYSNISDDWGIFNRHDVDSEWAKDSKNWSSLPSFQMGLWDSLRPYLDTGSPLLTALEALKKDRADGDGVVQAQVALEYLRALNPDTKDGLGLLKVGTDSPISDLMQLFGFWDGQFHAIKDTKGNLVSAKENAEGAASLMLRFREILQTAPQDVQTALSGFAAMLNSFSTVANNALNTPGAFGSVKYAGFTVDNNDTGWLNSMPTMNGHKYRWDAQRHKWFAIDNYALAGVENDAMLVANDKVRGVGTNDQKQKNTLKEFARENSGSTAHGSGRLRPSVSDYKSHYSNQNAAPKQVIVRIGNLMNVDKVDLSNPRNAEVVASLKEQLTQTLVDVVHDFDATWHG